MRGDVMRKEIIHTGGTNCYSNLVFERTQYEKPNMRIDIFDEDVSCDEIHLYSNLENQQPTPGEDSEEWDL